KPWPYDSQLSASPAAACRRASSACSTPPCVSATSTASRRANGVACMAIVNSGRQAFAERAQQRGAVATPGAAVHHGQRAGLLARQLLYQGTRVLGVGEIVHRLAKGLARFEDVRLDQRLLAEAALREQVAAEQRAARELHQAATLPAVRQVRCVQPFH